jgi:hypothetical protein
MHHTVFALHALLIQSYLNRWMRNVQAQPGLNASILDMLGKHVKQDPVKYGKVALMIDAMALKKHVSFDPTTQRSIGYVDLGFGSSEEEVASEALVLMVVGLMGHWKAPIAYFFSRTCNQETQKNLVEAALVALAEQGLTVVSLTMDGHATNLGMARLFGCDFRDPRNLTTTFPHPSTGFPVAVLIDACHVLKIVRNMLEAYRTISSPSGNISWAYFSKLNAVQNRAGLHLANKLSDRHINFKKQIMKVSLAAQTVSSSVAMAMKFLLEEGDPDFIGAAATIEFIEVSAVKLS